MRWGRGAVGGLELHDLPADVLAGTVDVLSVQGHGVDSTVTSCPDRNPCVAHVTPLGAGTLVPRLGRLNDMAPDSRGGSPPSRAGGASAVADAPPPTALSHRPPPPEGLPMSPIDRAGPPLRRAPPHTRRPDRSPVPAPGGAWSRSPSSSPPSAWARTRPVPEPYGWLFRRFVPPRLGPRHAGGTLRPPRFAQAVGPRFRLIASRARWPGPPPLPRRPRVRAGRGAAYRPCRLLPCLRGQPPRPAGASRGGAVDGPVVVGPRRPRPRFGLYRASRTGAPVPSPRRSA
jgi:hypothetical protein